MTDNITKRDFNQIFLAETAGFGFEFRRLLDDKKSFLGYFWSDEEATAKGRLAANGTFNFIRRSHWFDVSLYFGVSGAKIQTEDRVLDAELTCYAANWLEFGLSHAKSASGVKAASAEVVRWLGRLKVEVSLLDDKGPLDFDDFLMDRPLRFWLPPSFPGWRSPTTKANPAGLVERS